LAREVVDADWLNPAKSPDEAALEQQAGQIGAILAGNTEYERNYLARGLLLPHLNGLKAF
jgi:hypothetical protein